MKSMAWPKFLPLGSCLDCPALSSWWIAIGRYKLKWSLLWGRGVFITATETLRQKLVPGSWNITMTDLTALKKVVRTFEYRLEKLLSNLSSSGLFCGSKEANHVDRNAEDGGLSCNVTGGTLRVSYRLYQGCLILWIKKAVALAGWKWRIRCD